MKIGNTEIKNGLFLAPMAGVTDKAFRHMCIKYGAQFVVTEMVSAKAICYGDKKTGKLAEIPQDQRPSALQLFGSDPEIMKKAAKLVREKYNPNVIDINMGCPAPKIVNNGEGSALMKKPSLVYDIVSATKEGAGDVPVTVKIRSGFDENSINAVEIARMCEKGGAAAVFVHGRTRKQMYMPPVNLDVIKEVKESVKVPVVGNGDIQSPEDAKKMYEITGCDGIMIGRGALGNPYIFERILCDIKGEDYKEKSASQIKADILEHISMLCEDKGEFIGVCEARKHVAWYIKGMPGAANFRNMVNTAKTKDEVFKVVERAFEESL